MAKEKADHGEKNALRQVDKSRVFAMFKGGESPDGASIDPSHQLADAIGGTALLSRDKIEASKRLTNQVKIAVCHDKFPQTPGGRQPRDFSLDEVLEEVDGGEIFLGTGMVGDVRFDWLRFYSGDTGVGVIFAADPLEIIATIGDGDILGRWHEQALRHHE